MKITKIVTLIAVMIFSFLLGNKIIKAEDSFLMNRRNIINFEGKQFTRDRTIEVSLFLTDLNIDDLGDIRICEYNKTGEAEEVTYILLENSCRSGYEFPSSDYLYQISSPEDGSKYIGVSVSLKGSEGSYTGLGRKEIILDTSGPAISLKGNEAIYVSRGSTYEELGALFNDDYDPHPNLIISDNVVNTNKYGDIQYVTYTATDFIGNTTVVQRRIYVEVAPPRRLNTTIVIGVAVALFGGGIVVYINLMQKKEKKKQRELMYRNKNTVL